MEGTGPMKWNLRLAAANRGIWKASELQRLLAERGMVNCSVASAIQLQQVPESAALSRGVPPDELLAIQPSATMILIHELPGVCNGLPATTSASSRPCTSLSVATGCGGDRR